jgi:hypothetical protein
VKTDPTPSPPVEDPIPDPTLGENIRVTSPSSDDAAADDGGPSVADESDDAFATHESIATTDIDLVHSLAQIQGRRVEAERRLGKDNGPIPLSLKSSLKPKIVAKVAKSDMKWWPVTTCTTEKSAKRQWDTDYKQVFNALAMQSSIYPATSERTLCPDSGATSNMCPHEDMFIDYKDIRHEQHYVRLGDEHKRILIHGRGTMCLQVQGHTIAYADTLHVPELSAILLSTRVHRRSAVGCSFVADNSGCFLTYPNFQIEVDDEDDCTLPCQAVPADTKVYDFDSRIHVTQHLSASAVRRCEDLVFHSMHRARLAGIQKSQAHVNSSPTDVFPTIPVHSVANSGSSSIERINSTEIKKYVGSRGLADWSMLEHTGTGLHVIKDRDAPMTLGDVTAIARNPRGKLLQRPTNTLHTVGMDIGYGEGTSPGGYKYALTLVVDFASCYTWTYGLKNKTAESVIDALWCFFVDSGGLPTCIRCDFDSSFVKGKVDKFLKLHRIQVTSAPPRRQSQNGLVERQWQTAVVTARAMLIEARLPRRYWFWAIRESVIHMNLLPCQPIGTSDSPSPESTPPPEKLPHSDTSPEPPHSDNSPEPPYIEMAPAPSPEVAQPAKTSTALPSAPRSPPRPRGANDADKYAKLTTPYKLFYGQKPDYRVLFKWGCVGYYSRVTDSGVPRGNFNVQSSVGIAIGRSNQTNAMIFWDPGTSRMNVSSTYRLDPTACITTHLPQHHLRWPHQSFGSSRGDEFRQRTIPSGIQSDSTP